MTGHQVATPADTTTTTTTTSRRSRAHVPELHLEDDLYASGSTIAGMDGRPLISLTLYGRGDDGRLFNVADAWLSPTAAVQLRDELNRLIAKVPAVLADLQTAPAPLADVLREVATKVTA